MSDAVLPAIKLLSCKWWEQNALKMLRKVLKQVVREVKKFHKPDLTRGDALRDNKDYFQFFKLSQMQRRGTGWAMGISSPYMQAAVANAAPLIHANGTGSGGGSGSGSGCGGSGVSNLAARNEVYNLGHIKGQQDRVKCVWVWNAENYFKWLCKNEP